jgi:dipeptidase D
MTFVAELEPRAVWRHFDEILAIPRGSKKEARMRDHVIALAQKRGLTHDVDEAGNLVVRKPASKGREKAPITILQSHLDMVQEKNDDVTFDFERDAIEPRRDGEWLKASGTTLGADNGIGVASMLALLEGDDLEHGPLELLFTIDEESGLTGASGLSTSLLKGKRLINVDSEEEGIITIGCAGGATTRITLALADEPAPREAKALELRFHGLRGGHSGLDIHLQRGNAVTLLARTLFAASSAGSIRLAAFAGGNAHNAIPREARATLVCEAGRLDAVRRAIAAETEAIRAEYAKADPGLTATVTDGAAPARVWTLDTTAKALALLTGLPHGVLMMSLEIPGLVETSDNVATAAVEGGKLSVLVSTRSSVASALAALRGKVRAVATLAGADASEQDGYPGWKPNVASPLLAILKQVHADRNGREPGVGAVHAGLECGIVGEKYPGMDMVSFGPQIEHPHSPDERVHVDSVGRFYQLLTATLARLG